MIGDQKNMFLAIGLSLLVILGWQYFIGGPQLERQREEAKLRQAQQVQQTAPGTTPATRRYPPARRRVTARRDPATRWRRHPGRSRPAGRCRTDLYARGSPRRLAAGCDRNPDHQRLGLAARRPPRRRLADQISRNRRPEITGDRAAGAIRLPAPVLCAVRLEQRGRQQGQDPGRQHAVDAAGLRHARHRQADHAVLGQRRRPRIPAHDQRRRELSVHGRGQCHQSRQRAADALPLCADLASRQAGDPRLLHPA